MPGRDLSAELFDDAPPSGARDLSADLFGSAKPVNRAEQAGRAKPAWQQGLVVGANGLAMGFADEIAGAVGAVVDKVKNPASSLKDNYIANRDTVRGMEAAQRERAPITSAIGQGLSSIPLMMAAPVLGGVRAGAPVVAGLGARTGQAAAVGAGHGAVAGAGNSTEGNAAGVGADALMGGVIGGTFGGVLTPAAAGIKAVGGNIASRVSEKAAGNHARVKVAEALARDARGTLATGGRVNPMGQIGKRFERLGDEAVIADAGGRNANQLLDTLATLPGRTKESAANMLHRRQAGSGARLREAADKALGTNGQRLAATVDDLMETRAQQATPLYEQLRQTVIAPSEELANIVRAADELGATGTARRIATARGERFTLDVNAQGPQQWSMNNLDLVKQGIDDLIESNRNNGRLTPAGAAYQDLKNRLLNELDNVTTDPQTGQSLYKSARDAFAGPSAMITAANKGRMVISSDEVSIQREMANLSASERDAFKIGVYEGLRNKLGMQAGQTEIMNMWKNPSMQEKLRALFGNERSFRQFAADVSKEATLKKLQSVGTGSQTAARMAGMGDLDVNVLADAGAAFGAAKTGNILGAVGSVKNAWNRVATPERVRDEMGAMLLSRGSDGRNLLNSISPLVGQINSRNMLLSNQVGILGSLTGSGLIE